MLRLIHGRDAHRHPDLMDGAYRLRHRIFVEKMKWEALRRWLIAVTPVPSTASSASA
jgi:N-acyl-L-homoserine lactone synthetase